MSFPAMAVAIGSGELESRGCQGYRIFAPVQGFLPSDAKRARDMHLFYEIFNRDLDVI